MASPVQTTFISGTCWWAFATALTRRSLTEMRTSAPSLRSARSCSSASTRATPADVEVRRGRHALGEPGRDRPAHPAERLVGVPGCLLRRGCGPGRHLECRGGGPGSAGLASWRSASSCATRWARAASTSRRTIRPPGPVPARSVTSEPASRGEPAGERAGEDGAARRCRRRRRAGTARPGAGGAGDVPVAGAGCHARARRARRRRRPPSRRAGRAPRSACPPRPRCPRSPGSGG